MANKRVFKYITFPTRSENLGEIEEIIVKTPNGPGYFTVFTKSVVAGDTADLTIDASFVANPEPEDLVNTPPLTTTDVSEIVATEKVVEEANRYPYLKLTYEPTGVDITTEVYIGFY